LIRPRFISARGFQMTLEQTRAALKQLRADAERIDAALQGHTHAAAAKARHDVAHHEAYGTLHRLRNAVGDFRLALKNAGGGAP
jgi:hypothetical protein